jgi:acid phosphatase
MSYLCAFQVNALGSSPFCDIFSDLEWEHLNYARDLATYYGSGPGNPYGIAMGIPWVEAVINLMLNSSSSNNNIYLSLYVPAIIYNVSNF